ncbi:MAG: hypothetical protein MGG11_01735 [Trichodesmium sp. MAG_R03]|nr:hypothetical protein [Trichodesmium sp. MAG_R03]
MKTKLSIFSVAIIGGLIATIPAQAASMFDDQGIYFEKETTVQFDFLQSNGWWQANFGVKNLDTEKAEILLVEDLNIDPGSGWANDNLGTAGIAVTQTSNSFTFEANTNYTLFLESLNPDGNPDTPYNIQYSTTSENPTWYKFGTGDGAIGDGNFKMTKNDYDSSIDNTILAGQQRVLFKGDLFNESLVKLFFEDNTTWTSSNDFDDFVVKATINTRGQPNHDSKPTDAIISNVESIPEPATFAGLALVVGGIFLSGCCEKQN